MFLANHYCNSRKFKKKYSPEQVLSIMKMYGISKRHIDKYVDRTTQNTFYKGKCSTAKTADKIVFAIKVIVEKHLQHKDQNLSKPIEEISRAYGINLTSSLFETFSDVLKCISYLDNKNAEIISKMVYEFIIKSSGLLFLYGVHPDKKGYEETLNEMLKEKSKNN